jgi:hypothetical protein
MYTLVIMMHSSFFGLIRYWLLLNPACLCSRVWGLFLMMSVLVSAVCCQFYATLLLCYFVTVSVIRCNGTKDAI